MACAEVDEICILKAKGFNTKFIWESALKNKTLFKNYNSTEHRSNRT